MSSKLDQAIGGGDGKKEGTGEGMSPNFLITCEGSVVKAFVVEFPEGTEKAKGICTVTNLGAVTIWNMNGKSKLLEIATGIEQTVSAKLIFGDVRHPSWLLVLQSRLKGIVVFKLSKPETENPYTLFPTPFQPHLGFCTIQLVEELLYFPSGSNSFGIIALFGLRQSRFEAKLPLMMKQEMTEGMIMFLKVVSNNQDDEVLMFGTETGIIRMVSIIRVRSDYNGTDQVVFIRWKNDLNLNAYVQSRRRKSANHEQEEPISPLCCETLPGLDSAIIGTNSRYIYTISFDLMEKVMSFNYRNTLSNKGLNAMDVHPNGRLVATGCWDGGIRIYNLPNFHRVLHIRYHQLQINSVKFFNPDGAVSKNFMLLASAQDGQVSVWNPAEKLSQACQE